MYQMDKRENYEEKVVCDRVLFCRKESVEELANKYYIYHLYICICNYILNLVYIVTHI